MTIKEDSWAVRRELPQGAKVPYPAIPFSDCPLGTVIEVQSKDQGEEGVYECVFYVKGGEDKLVPADGAEEFGQKIGSKDKSIKIYQGLYHEVFNEPEHKQVLKDVENWLEKHI